MAKYLSDDEFFSMAEGQPEYLSDDEFFAMAAEKDDPARVEAPRRSITDTARENLPTIDKSLQLSPSKEPQYRSVLEDAAPIEDVPRASKAPLRPEVRRALESSWDAGSGQQRALLENTAGVTGQVARERGAVFDRADKSAMATPTGKATDSRVEARRAELVRKGEHPQFARRAAYEGAAKGVNPGDEIRALDGTVQESTMDFETRKLFDQNQEVNGLNNSLVRGVAKGGLGATKALAGYGQFLSEVYGLDNAARKTADYGDELRKKEDAIGDGGGGLRGNFEGTVASIAQQLPLWLTGSQPIALAGMALQSFGQEYSDGRSKGQTTVQAAERASMFAAFEVIGEKFGLKGNMDSLKKLLDGQTNAAAMGFLSNMLKREIPGELLTTTGQFGVDKFGADGVALNPNATAGDYFAQVKDTIFQTVMQGGLMSGGSKVAGSAANAVSGWRQSRIDQDPSAALAQALESGQFAPGSVGASVADALRTQPGTSNAISPAATTMGAPISAPQVDAKAVVESARDAAMADIGKAQSVDEAVASANMATNLAGRAVQIDGERLLNETLQAAGLADALASAGVAQQPTAETVGAAQAAPLAGGQSTVTASTSPNYGVPNAVAPSRVVWTGRRGDGYATPEDATRALNERQRLRPAYDWTVQQNPEGRYVLEGQPKGQNGAMQASMPSANTNAAPMAQNAPEAAYGGGDVSVRGRPYQGDLRQQPADSGVDVDAAAAVQELAVAAGSPGGFHAVSREVALRELDAGEQRQRSMEARGLSAARSPAVPAEVLGDIENFVEAAQASFGTRPVMMSGPKDVFGVQYRGRTFFNISAIANGDRKGNLVQAIALQTIGHETTHDLEKSANPQDRADHALLRQAVLGNAKDGVVAQRVTREQKDLKRLPGESDAQYAARSQRYGEKEVVADVSGNFWTDPKFWERLYDLDKAAMRRIAYKFMEKATKLLKTVKGSRLDNETFINNIEQVREVAAQVWARKAQRGDSLFDGKDQTVSKSQTDDARPGVSAPAPKQAPKSVTRTEGDTLVRRPEGNEVMGIIAARKAGLEMAAPSFKMQFGEARVLASEASTADAVLESVGASFRFGEPAFSRADQTETDSFKRWFGDSKVVDADGKPLVVYHGSPNATFTEFDVSNVGVFFSDRFDIAASYAGRYNDVEFDEEGAYVDDEEDQGVYSAYLSAKNPMVVDWRGKDWGVGPEGLKLDDWAARAKRAGYDSLVVENVVDTGWLAPGLVEDDGLGRVFVVFRPEQIKSATGNNGNFDPEDERINYSRDFDELGAFNIDAELDSLDDALTEKDVDAIQAELMAEFEAEFGAMASKPKAGAPSKDAIAKAGLNAEDAFDFAGALKESGQGLAYDVPDFADDLVLRVSLGSDVDAPRATVELADGVAVFVNARTASRGAVEKLIARQVAGAQLRKDKHDIASAYRKNTILNLAANWKAVARKAGVFKFGEGSKATGFAEIAKSMGAFKGYRVEVTENYGGFNVEFARESDGRGFNAEVTEHQSVRCCTMGLDGSGGLGTEFYAVMGRYAQNNGKRFLADEYLSGINSYRRTEQALSFALKSGDTGVLLPGPQNRVYGYNTQPKTQEEHDKNLARLALAGLRNVQELYPDVRRLRYDPATDRFSDSQGDAEDKVAKALKNKDARAFGLGRSTVARAVITSQIIKGEAIKADKFESPIAYSLADVGLDEPMAESWGDERGGVTPGLRRFVAGSKIVHSDGRPVMMYHGTAQDIHAFRGKQAGAIFLSYSPRFAGDFAALSGQWMQDHWTQVLTPEQQEQAKKVAAAAVMADKSVKMAERKAMKQSIMDGKPEGMAKGAMNEAVRDMMPSGENVLPVFVRATAPFDFRDKAMVDDVVGFLFDKNMAGENDKVRIRLVSEKGDRANMNARTMRELMGTGAWDVIESPEVQEVIRELGHDGFFVKEDGQINLAVYDPGQVKSVFNRGTFDPLDERLSYSRRAGPKEFNYRDNYLVPELDGAFDDDSGNIAVMPALIFAKDGIRREFKSMPVRIKIGDHQRVQTGNAVKQQGLQHRIENQRKDAAYRGYITPALEGDVTEPTAAEVERAARDITLGVLDSKTAYADGSPAKIYLHSPSLNRQTVLERQRDAKGKDFWSVITVSPSDRNQMMRRYKAPTSVVGVSLNGDRTQQANDTLLGILKKLREPGKPPVTSESYILDEDGLLFHQDPARKSTNKADAPKAVKQLPRDENGRIILNRRKAQADGGASMSRADIDSLGMYSALARGVSDMKASAAPVAGWKELIKGMVNKGQAKQDEVEWSGLNDWLDTRQGRVTKDEVLEYLRGNGVQVQEVVLGEKDTSPRFFEWLESLGYTEATASALDAARKLELTAQYERDHPVPKGTKYDKYTLPGGKNYREVLLTLPDRKVGINTAGWTANLRRAKSPVTGLPEFEVLDAYGGVVGVSYKASNERDAIEMVAARDGMTKEQQTRYKSSHWDQPNILAHIRVNDRTDADGERVLFVEEIQSDWGQDGKKKGFAQPVASMAIKVTGEDLTVAKMLELEGAQGQDWLDGRNEMRKDMNEPPLTASDMLRSLFENGKRVILTDRIARPLSAAIAERQARVNAAAKSLEREEATKNAGKIPLAPFVTKTDGWLNLALKRIITMAVGGGYDKVAFVNGEQSADRYDLSKQVSDIQYTKEANGKYYIVVGGPRGGIHSGEHTASELEDYVGKELAQRIVDRADDSMKELSGLDLKVGGEGMKAFYDAIVPNTVNALLKKVGGGQLETVNIHSHAKHSSQGATFGDTSIDPSLAKIEKIDGAWRVVVGDMLHGVRFRTRKEAQGYIDANTVRKTPQVGFDITPAMREKVGEGLPSFSRANGGFDLPEETRTQKARRNMQDYFLRAQVVQRAIAGQGGVVDEQTDFYRAEELSHGRTASLMKDFADHQVQPLMEKAVKLGIELDELSLYAYAMHAKERNAYIASIDPKLQDGGSGMTNDEADSILDLVKLSGDQAKFDELHTDLITITRGNRLAMLADGLITQQEFEALEGAYEYYVPLRGFEKLDEDGKPAPARSAGKGFNIRGAETIRAKGRVSRAGQIIENIIHDHQRTIARGERNHVAKVFLNFVLKNPDPDLWEIDATTTRKSIDRKTGRIARDTAIEKGEDTISVKLQGQEVYIRIKDEMLLRALRKSHADETGQLTSDLMKSVGLYSTLLRNTLTRYNPEFAVVNAMRDVGFGATAVLDELGEKGVAKYMAHYAGAMAVSARNESKKLDASSEWDRWFNEFKAAGGTTSGFYAKGLDEIGSDIRDMMIEAGAAPKDWSEKVRFNKATRATKGALRVLEWAGSVSENAARVAAYRTAREMGKTPSQAASIAKNLTTNFDRKGEYGQLTNALYLFYNAGIQGTHRTVKMLKNPRVWGYMGSVTAAMVALAFHNAGEDDPEDGMAYWDKIPAHVKERNIIIMLPPGAQVEGAEEVGTKGRYVTIPVQYGLNIFHVMGYQIADVLRNQQDPVRGVNWKKAVINMASATAGSFNPFGGSVDLTNGSSVIQAVLPTVFDFPYQLVSGTNAFGRDVAPFKSPFDAKPDSQNSNVRQAGGPAERVAQWLNDVTGGSDYEAGAVDVSAGTLENVVRGLTGGTGAFVYDVIALGGKWAEQVGGGDPDLFVRDMPIVRRLTGETAGDVDQGLFYERRKAIQEARAIEKAANEAGVEIADKEKIALSSLNGDAGKTTRWLAEVRREMKDAQRDESLTPQERRLKLRELRAERDRLTASFNAAFMEVMREELAPSLVDE